MSKIPNGAKRTFFAACEAALRKLALKFSGGTNRLLDAADWCGERAR